MPLTSCTRIALRAWLNEPARQGTSALFPNVHGGRLSADSVQALLAKHVSVATKNCPSLASKRVSPHVLRHYLPFLTMSGTASGPHGVSGTSQAAADPSRDIVPQGSIGC